MNLAKTRTWCTRAHGAQKYGKRPYSYHLRNAENVARRFGFTDAKILKACWAHDVLEDTKATAEDMLTAGFDADVVAIACAVTDEPGATRLERKLKTYPKIVATPGAIIVKLCDRITNVEECLANSPHKFDTYRNEFPGFAEHLRDRSDKTVEAMWNYLEFLCTAALPA